MNVEVWCLVTLEDEEQKPATGQIIGHDEHGSVFVRFAPDAVPDEPWTKAPKEVAVLRKGEKIGTARLAGGWVLGQDGKRPPIAVYQLAEGTPLDGDSVTAIP
jgi:hypothetical protein